MIKKMLMVLVMFVCVLGVGYVECHDTREAIIVSCDNEIVIAKDNAGYLWAFEGEGYAEGQAVKLTLNNNNTEDITDDEIIKVTIR